MTEIKKALSIFNIHPCGPVYKIVDLEKKSFFAFNLVQYISNGLKMVLIVSFFRGWGLYSCFGSILNGSIFSDTLFERSL